MSEMEQEAIASRLLARARLILVAHDTAVRTERAVLAGQMNGLLREMGSAGFSRHRASLLRGIAWRMTVLEQRDNLRRGRMLAAMSRLAAAAYGERRLALPLP